MRIMGLDFRTAVKYGFLGDTIYRLEKGRGRRYRVALNAAGDEPVLFNKFDNVAIDINGMDLLADDWVAESSEKSV